MSTSPDADDPVTGHGQSPASLGDRGVVPTTQGDEVLDGGRPLVLPSSDVMEIGPLDRRTAPREPTALIAGVHGSPHTSRDHGRRGRDPEHLAAIGEQEAQVCIAGEPTDRLRGQPRWRPDGGPEKARIAGDLVVTGQRRDVGDDLDAGPRSSSSLATSQEALGEPEQPIGALAGTARSRYVIVVATAS